MLKAHCWYQVCDKEFVKYGGISQTIGTTPAVHTHCSIPPCSTPPAKCVRTGRGGGDCSARSIHVGTILSPTPAAGDTVNAHVHPHNVCIRGRHKRWVSRAAWCELLANVKSSQSDTDNPSLGQLLIFALSDSHSDRFGMGGIHI